jgi:hypothetical protein
VISMVGSIKETCSRVLFEGVTVPRCMLVAQQKMAKKVKFKCHNIFLF